MQPEHPQPELALLEDRVPASLKRSRRFAANTAAFGLIFAWFILQPLWHTDIWGHLNYGRWIAQHRTLPDTDPLLPLTRGVPLVDSAWLSQLVGYLTYQQLGLAGLQSLLALTVTVTCAAIYHRLLERTRSNASAWLGVGVFLWLNWGLLTVVRPQMAGLLCFVILLHRLTSRQWRPLDYCGIPLLLALWTNMHGSFVVGLALIACFLVGRSLDVVRRTGRISRLWSDSRTRSLWVLLQLSAVATLLNPYGLGLYAEVLSVSRNPNLQALTEWQTLDFRATHGQVFLLSAMLLAVLYRITPRRIAAWEPLVLFGLAAATVTSARFAIWWGPVAAYVGMLHLHAACRHWIPWRAELPASPVNGKWSVVAAGIAWIVFAYSPLGMRVLHHKEPNISKATVAQTPAELTRWLNEHPPTGLVFNPYEWGDYLQFAGPTDLQLFLNSHAHLLPREVWQHYLAVTQQSSDWQATLDRYGVNTVILDSQFRSGLIRRLKDSPEWQVAYEDVRGTVFQRRRPV